MSRLQRDVPLIKIHSIFSIIRTKRNLQVKIDLIIRCLSSKATQRYDSSEFLQIFISFFNKIIFKCSKMAVYTLSPPSVFCPPES